MVDSELSYDFKSAKKPFSRIGLALVLFMLATTVAQFIIITAVIIINPSIATTGFSTSATMLISDISMYLFGLPVFCLMVVPLKTEAPSKIPCKPSTLIVTFLIAIELMYLGGNLGRIVYSVFLNWLNIDLSSEVLTMASDISWLESFIYLAVLAPIVEEIMFRKLILDRTKMYGEKLALIFSALTFAIFHMNVEQFFYAFFIGLLLGYLYLRRGKIFPCILIHAAINFFGGVLPSILEDLVDMEALVKASEEQNFDAIMTIVEQNPLNYMLYSAYDIALMLFSFVGFFLLLKKTRKLTFKNTSMQLPKDSEATVAFTNFGVIIFVLFSLIYTLVNAYLLSIA